MLDVKVFLVILNTQQAHRDAYHKIKNSWWWAERLPETCRVVIPLKL